MHNACKWFCKKDFTMDSKDQRRLWPPIHCFASKHNYHNRSLSCLWMAPNVSTSNSNQFLFFSNLPNITWNAWDWGQFVNFFHLQPYIVIVMINLQQPNSTEPAARYLIPEKLFAGKPTHVFRKYVHTKPWKSKSN